MPHIALLQKAARPAVMIATLLVRPSQRAHP